KHYKNEKDYEVLDEIHFWLNGDGVTNKRRTALFVLNPGGTPRRITEPEFDLDDMLAMNGKVYFTGTFYTDRRPLRNEGLYCLDPDSGTLTRVLDCPGRSVDSLTQVGNKIWCASSNGARYGVNENEWVYEFDPLTGAFEVLREEELNMYGSVGSDCRWGGGEQWQSKGGSLYHVATREGNAVLLRLDTDGSSYPVVTKPGSIDAIALSEKTNEALLIALYDNRLQELYAADLATGAVRRLSSFNEEVLKDTYVAEPRSMTICSEGMD
ncbi:acylamino-acid-releasing protein, partial [gut metagenome]